MKKNTVSKINPIHLTVQGVFEVDKESGLTLIEIAEDVQIEDIIGSTGCEFNIAEDLKPMRQA